MSAATMYDPVGSSEPEPRTPNPEPSLDRLLARLFAPIDIASLCFFRIGFGAMMAWWAWDYLSSGRMRFFYVQPRFHFTYFPFDWVRPWPGDGMFLHFLALAALALAIAFGLCYRLASVLFAVGFTYVFLLDATNYQNHYYLLLLTSWMLPLLPLHRAVSVDAAWRPALRSDTAPTWALWLLRLHVALPYFFGGVAKLDPDWLAGEPLRQILAAQSTLPLLGPLLKQEPIVLMLTWGSLLFDLGIVPLLLWRPTRAVAYGFCVVFHVINSVFFQIHVFPWFMLFGTTLFFEPDWPRRVLGGGRLALPSSAQRISWSSLPHLARLGLIAAAIYGAFHIWWPLRHHFYAGNASWTEQGHFFSWRMMLRLKNVGLRYYLTEPESGKTWIPDVRPYINSEQSTRFTRDPEMILQMAHFLAHEHRRETGRDVEVRALALASLNGRKPELLIDPSVDLAKEPRGFYRRKWIMPQRELLRDEPWSVPLMEWERHVKLPPLPRVTRGKHEGTKDTKGGE
jgi:hypothetical protein